jgi:hypothetical protein
MKSRKNGPFEEEKLLLHHENAPCHKSIKTMAKLHELGYECLPYPPYSLDLAPSDFFMIAGLKKMLNGKKFITNEGTISYYKNCIEKLYAHYNRCIALEDSRSLFGISVLKFYSFLIKNA